MLSFKNASAEKTHFQAEENILHMREDNSKSEINLKVQINLL